LVTNHDSTCSYDCGTDVAKHVTKRDLILSNKILIFDYFGLSPIENITLSCVIILVFSIQMTYILRFAPIIGEKLLFGGYSCVHSQLNGPD
jgi:hypothetical protein